TATPTTTTSIQSLTRRFPAARACPRFGAATAFADGGGTRVTAQRGGRRWRNLRLRHPGRTDGLAIAVAPRTQQPWRGRSTTGPQLHQRAPNRIVAAPAGTQR